MGLKRGGGLVVGVGLALWLLGIAALGTRWHGVEVAPGLWRDAVPLQRWALFWAGLYASGVLAARWLPTWGMRAMALVPVLGWIAVELSRGSLGPLAWVIYAVPSLAAWAAGLLTGGFVGKPLARGVKRFRA